MKFAFALGVVGLSGFISLSYEILWYRAISVASGATAAAFGLLLGFYLLGIALGGWVAAHMCRDPEARGDPRLIQSAAGFFLLANGIGFLVLPSLAWFASLGVWPVALVFVMVAAAMFGAVLPVISHFAVSPDWLAGRWVSYLYVANIVGSVLGSFLTGFVLLEWLPLRGVALSLVLLGGFVTLLLVALGMASRPAPLRALAALGVSLGLPILALPVAFNRFYERLQFGPAAAELPSFSEVVENRSGVITVTPDGTIYGNGAYDGKITTDLVDDRNLIVRAYALAAMHDAPREVLMIGMGGGAWAQVAANLPGVERLTIIEINPGYMDVIRRHAEVAGLLENPKIEIVIDDGRRWLTRNPERRFDLIVSNTSQHWRAHATHLLSVEFLGLIRRHLLPGGVYYFNTTYSHDALKTAMTAFPSGWLIINFAAVGDSVPFDRERLRETLARFVIDGRPIWGDPGAGTQRLIEEIAGLRVVDRETILRRSGFARIVTDDNMVTEWYPSPEQWQ